MVAMAPTIQERPERGTWRVTVHRGGRRVRRDCATREEAEALCRALTAREGALNDWLSETAPLVGQAVRAWIEHYRGTLSPGYEATARALIEHHLVPRLGHLPLRAISEADLIAFAEATVTAGKSPSTAGNALSLLRRVCQLYVQAGLLDRNPCARVGALIARVQRRHDPEIRQADAWTREEAETLLALALEHELALYGPLLCALHTGMRRGEVIALEWRDVGPARIAVRRAWVRGRTRVPKGGQAREIPISSGLRACMEEIREQQRTAKAWRELGPVFLAPNGLRWDEAAFGRAWRRLMAHALANEVRVLRYHDARHTFASWALAAGQSIKWVQERLGHSSAELTLRTYAHLIRSDGDEMGWLDEARPQSAPRQPPVLVAGSGVTLRNDIGARDEARTRDPQLGKLTTK